VFVVVVVGVLHNVVEQVIEHKVHRTTSAGRDAVPIRKCVERLVNPGDLVHAVLDAQLEDLHFPVSAPPETMP